MLAGDVDTGKAILRDYHAEWSNDLLVLPMRLTVRDIAVIEKIIT